MSLQLDTLGSLCLRASVRVDPSRYDLTPEAEARIFAGIMGEIAADEIHARDLRAFEDRLVASQRELPPDAQRLLNENAWQLYDDDAEVSQ